jgi:hypothetical protein
MATLLEIEALRGTALNIACRELLKAWVCSQPGLYGSRQPMWGMSYFPDVIWQVPGDLYPDQLGRINPIYCKTA